MRNRKLIVVIVGLLTVNLFLVWRVFAGNPDSPAAPNATYGYTLEDLFNRLMAGTTGSQSTFTEPAVAPGTGSMHTIDEIMGIAPAADNTNGALSSEVVSGKTFWGLDPGQWGLQTGSATTGSDVEGGDGQLIFPIPGAFYTGTEACIATDSDLVSTNIISGTTIFGVTGSYLCQDGLTNCSDTCVNSDTDRNNCGSCGYICPDGHVCQIGTCSLSCQPELTDCSGICRDLSSDEENCGNCGFACPPGHLCTDSTCILSCQEGLTACSDTCTDTLTDIENCGDCDIACDLNSQLCCHGHCASYWTDEENCGECGNVCQGTDLCCDGGCTDILYNHENCGDCGIACDPSQICLAGFCVEP